MAPTHPRLTRTRTVVALAATALVAVPVAAIATPGGNGGDGGLRDVRVINTQTEPVPVSPQGVQQVAVLPQGQPVSVQDPMVMAPGENLLQRELLTVPAGKRFVAEYVSGEPLIPDTGRIRVRVGPSTGPHLRMPIQPSLGNEPGLLRGQFSEVVHFVVDGPGSVTAEIQRVAPDSTTTIASPVILTGTLYDCPSCS